MSDRKYRQRGYMDDDRDRGRAGTARGAVRPDRGEAPRGRGLGRPEREVFRCKSCGEEAAAAEIGPTTACVRCGAALHACVQCVSFDPSARWECRAQITEPVRSKTKANECALFRPRTAVELGAGREGGEDPRAAFDALFR